MTEDKMDHREQIQTTVSATFAAPLVPTDIELGAAAIEVLSPPLVEQDDSVPAAEDKVDDWVREFRKIDGTNFGIEQTVGRCTCSAYPLV